MCAELAKVNGKNESSHKSENKEKEICVNLAVAFPTTKVMATVHEK